MHRTFDLIINALKAGKVVLLHCKAGRHRAGVVAGTFLAIVYDVPWSQAMSMVIEKRRGYVRYSDRDKTIVQEIASALDLQPLQALVLAHTPFARACACKLGGGVKIYENPLTPHGSSLR